MVIFLKNLYICHLWSFFYIIYAFCFNITALFANTDSSVDPKNSVLNRLWCKAQTSLQELLNLTTITSEKKKKKIDISAIVNKKSKCIADGILKFILLFSKRGLGNSCEPSTR